MVKTGITIYECEQDEATLFQEMASRFDIEPTITSEPISEATAKLALGNKCISVSHKTQITPSILHALHYMGVEYISTRSAGYNHIDIEFAQSLGMSVGNVLYSPDSVADYTIMLMLMLVRNMKSTINNVAMGDFRLHGIRGKELRDMTIGIIGTGRIGTAVIDRLTGFGCRTLTYDHHPGIAGNNVSLEELLHSSDIVTLHTPLNKETRHLLDNKRFAQMKKGAFVVNTGRGALINTEDLIEALESSRLSGAALDVLEGEEGIFYFDHRDKVIENESLLRLQKLPNVLITPHTAYYTDHALTDVVEHTIVNCLTFEKEKVYE